MIDSVMRITLNLQETNTLVSVKAKRGDTGRKLLIHLSDGSIPYAIARDCYAVFTAGKSDGSKIHNPCTIENNVIEYTFTEQTCSLPGTMHCEIRLYGADRKLLTSACFLMTVFDTVYREGDEVGSEEEMNTLDALIADASGLIADVQQKLENGEFTGPRGDQGEPGQPGKDYVLTEADKTEIAGMAAELVEVPDVGGNTEFCIVNVIADDSTSDIKYRADKTSKEIHQAWKNGTPIYCKYNCGGFPFVLSPFFISSDVAYFTQCGVTSEWGRLGVGIRISGDVVTPVDFEIPTADDIPTKLSELNNDVGFMTMEAAEQVLKDFAENLPAPDWNAAQGEPGHILNRPFYSYIGRTAILEGTFQPGVTEQEFKLSKDETYSVFVNGVECVGKYDSGGGGFLDVLDTDGNEVGIYIFGYTEYTCVDNRTPADVELTVIGSGEIVEKMIPMKYLDMEAIREAVGTPGTGGNVAYDEAQNLTDEQKAQARENIGAQPKGNYLTEVPEGYAKTEDIPTDAEIIQLIKNNAPASSGGGIAVSGATVGQTVKISAVDENGVPTAWEPADFLGASWTLLNEIVTDGATSAYWISEDANGVPYSWREMYVFWNADSGAVGEGTSPTNISFFSVVTTNPWYNPKYTVTVSDTASWHGKGASFNCEYGYGFNKNSYGNWLIVSTANGSYDYQIENNLGSSYAIRTVYVQRNDCLPAGKIKIYGRGRV